MLKNNWDFTPEWYLYISNRTPKALAMAFTLPGNMQWVTPWKSSHYLCQSSFPSQRKAQWHCGAEGHQLAHCKRATIHSLWTTSELPQIYWSAWHGAFPCRWTLCPKEHSLSVSIPHYFMLDRHAEGASQKAKPRNPWQKFCHGTYQASICPELLPGPLTGSISPFTPRGSHSAGCFRSKHLFPRDAHLLTWIWFLQ